MIEITSRHLLVKYGHRQTLNQEIILKLQSQMEDSLFIVGICDVTTVSTSLAIREHQFNFFLKRKMTFLTFNAFLYV